MIFDNFELQTDRPRTEYWNSGLVQALRDLAKKYGLAFVHFTEQAHHNKVNNESIKTQNICDIQDMVDGEFSRYKDALTINLERHDADKEDYIEVLNSETFVKFSNKHLTKPGPKSGIKERMFYDLKESKVMERLSEKPGFKTLNGINSVFQYICKPTGEVLWRKLPCFCSNCSNLQWEKCKCKDIVGSLKVVLKAGEEF